MINNLPKHIVRLIFLLFFFLLLALIAKIYLTDPSFYKYGHYRADAIPELMAGEPLFRGTIHCRTCHDENQYDTSVGEHKSVQCEVCHGTSRNHPDEGNMHVPTDTIRLCSNCHEKMPARPTRQPQIVVSEHLSADEAASQCHNCHSPHSPAEESPTTSVSGNESLSVTKAERIASLSDLLSKCAKCHGKNGEGRRKNPPLAGMKSAVFIERITGFKSASNKDNKMAKYAKPLSEEEVVELAIFYEGLPVTPHTSHEQD